MIFNYKKFKLNEKIKLILTYFVIILKRKIMNLIQNSFDLIKIYSNINKIKRKIKYNIKIKYKKSKLKNLSIDANIKSSKNLKKNISCKSEYYRAISQKKIALNIFTLKNNNYSIKNIQKEKLQTNENINKIYKKILIQNLVGKIKKFILKKSMNLFINKLKLKILNVFNLDIFNNFSKNFFIFNLYIEFILFNFFN